MALQLKHVFPCIRMGSGKVESDALVNLDSCCIEKADKGGNAGLRNGSGQKTGKRSKLRSGQAYDTDATPPGRGGNGSNQVSLLSACHPRSSA